MGVHVLLLPVRERPLQQFTPWTVGASDLSKVNTVFRSWAAPSRQYGDYSRRYILAQIFTCALNTMFLMRLNAPASRVSALEMGAPPPGPHEGSQIKSVTVSLSPKV